MIDPVDSKIAILVWNGIDPSSGQRRRHGDASLLALLSDPLTVESLVAFGAGHHRRTGGYELLGRLAGGPNAWAPLLQILRRGMASGIEGAAVLIGAISELGRDIGGTPLDLGSASTLAFFLRPDLPVMRLDRGASWLLDEEYHAPATDIAMRRTKALLRLLPKNPPISYPEGSEVTRDWYRRRCLDLALRRRGNLARRSVQTVH